MFRRWKKIWTESMGKNPGRGGGRRRENGGKGRGKGERKGGGGGGEVVGMEEG